MARSRIVIASEDQELDPRHFLGRMSTFSMPDRPVNASKLIRWWGDAGLDMDLLPDVKRQPVHVFQRACGSVKRRRASNGTARTEITADEVFNNGTCVYQITVKVWDEAGRAIEHEKALRVTFDKDPANPEITFDHLGYEDKMLDKVESDIRTHFEQHAKDVMGQKVRKSIVAVLRSVGAQNLRRKAGGLYFVPAEWQSNGRKPALTKPTLDALREVLEKAYGFDADFYTWPLINDDGAQEMVSKHFTLNVRDEAQAIMLEVVERNRQMREVLKTGKGRRVREDAMANYYNKLRKLKAANAQFENLVALEKSGITADLELLEKSLSELADLRIDD
jgi:hypothetical protein